MSIENIEQPKTQEEKLTDCTRDVEVIKATEKSGEKISAHFLETSMGPEMDTSNLTEEDGEIWHKFKNKTLELKEFKEYKNKVANGDTKNEDSHSLVQYIANQADYWQKIFSDGK